MTRTLAFLAAILATSPVLAQPSPGAAREPDSHATVERLNQQSLDRERGQAASAATVPATSWLGAPLLKDTVSQTAMPAEYR